MAKAGRIQHWKHGWIPISPQAKAYVAGRGPRPVTGKKAASLIDEIKEHGGFTYNPRNGEVLQVGEAKGFAVAVPGSERVVGKETVGGDYVTREDFANGFADVVEQYADEIANGAMIGGWYSPERNEFMVELTNILDPNDRDAAIRAGQEGNQEAIFDLATGETISTGGTGDVHAVQAVADTPVSTDLMRPLSHEEVAAARFYTGPGFKPLNGNLRRGTDMHPATAFYRDKLDAAIDSSRVSPPGAEVYRGIQTWPGFPERFEPGDEWEDKGYMSTATDPNGQYGGDVKMVISVPPGAAGLDLYGMGLSHHPDEKELLLPHGTKLRVISETKVGAQRVVKMEVVT